MKAPRIDINLSKIRHNTQSLVRRLASRGIGVTAVTKGVCGHPTIVQAMIDGGAMSLSDARISNVQRMRRAGITCPITLIRSPMLSEADAVVQYCETSYNTEIDVISRLAEAASKRKMPHNIILMVEMGDMREGIMPENLAAIAAQVIAMPGVNLKGIGANFACLNGVAPNAADMAAFSTHANEIEKICGPFIDIVSGGNSANLPWAFGTQLTGRINDLRIGEAILLGVDPVSGDQIDGLYTDAFQLVAEVIETKIKPNPARTPFVGPIRAAPHLVPENDPMTRSILAVGNQDTDVSGLTMPLGVKYQGATSDHLVMHVIDDDLRVGSEVKIQMNYSALVRAMAAHDVGKTFPTTSSIPTHNPPKYSVPCLVLM